MRRLLLTVVLCAAGCAQQRAMNTCDALGVPRGTPAYVSCFNAQMDRQERAFEAMQRQNWMQQQQATQVEMQMLRPAWTASCNTYGTLTTCRGY